MSADLARYLGQNTQLTRLHMHNSFMAPTLACCKCNRAGTCKCNRAGTCQNCACVKNRQLCQNCLPRRLGNCVNTVHTQPPFAASSDKSTPPSSSAPDNVPETSPARTEYRGVRRVREMYTEYGIINLYSEYRLSIIMTLLYLYTQSK